MRQKISRAFIPPTEDDSCLRSKQLGGFSAHRFDKYGVYIVDDNGICVRCFNRLGAANGWLDKHCAYLSDDEKRKRIWTFNSRNQVKRFFDTQISRGCVDNDVIACMCYYCGVVTKIGLDLKNGKIKNTTLS